MPVRVVFIVPSFYIWSEGRESQYFLTMNSAFPPEEQVSGSVGSDGARLERNRVDGGKGSRAASALAEQILTVDASGDVDITAGSRSGQTGVCDAAGAGVISSTVVKEAPPFVLLRTTQVLLFFSQLARQDHGAAEAVTVNSVEKDRFFQKCLILKSAI